MLISSYTLLCYHLNCNVYVHLKTKNVDWLIYHLIPCSISWKSVSFSLIQADKGDKHVDLIQVYGQTTLVLPPTLKVGIRLWCGEWGLPVPWGGRYMRCQCLRGMVAHARVGQIATKLHHLELGGGGVWKASVFGLESIYSYSMSPC